MKALIEVDGPQDLPDGTFILSPERGSFGELFDQFQLGVPLTFFIHPAFHLSLLYKLVEEAQEVTCYVTSCNDPVFMARFPSVRSQKARTRTKLKLTPMEDILEGIKKGVFE